jgi:hypothetical protein
MRHELNVRFSAAADDFSDRIADLSAPSGATCNEEPP